MYNYSERSKKYDELLARAEQVLAKFNPCNVIAGVCARGRRGKQNFCCTSCKNLSETGCTTDPLYCRIWICEYTDLLGAQQLEFTRLMQGIYDEAEEYGLLGFRKGKVETLTDKNSSYFETVFGC